ncbi:protein phosphatase 2C domain-containing protein [Amycolatopsis sp. H20-H5]|uniref:protein phosphatase 2C domain-containing protein n=1 Tax=Amycolatopsis sp. H20-H5 TaxID=3046309 RepID=UPI002DBC256C|nr:protein phosphatase 2C domain-containing protein [Amycolatopsis sp. H20-H5]MEC3975718.1 protein phosphatase 2C domain-containing protein [Amycolatopsis sp. H20-H5]
MQIVGVRRQGCALWQQGEPGLVVLGVWTEKKPGRGEDAEPLLVHKLAGDSGLIAVFDGAGGAGSAAAGRTPGGQERTGAWVGSRTARAATEEWYVLGLKDPADAGPAGLKRVLRERLGAMAVGSVSKISGSMRRLLPTTLAAVDYAREGEVVSWNVLWAGDSRCYLLGEHAGLQQLTVDDTESADALTLLTDDPPMTNLVAADREFTVHCVPGETAAPCVLLCATDGFFGYVLTPADFEHVLLHALHTAVDAEQWASNLIDAVSSYTADDASLALVAMGFRDFEHLRATFAERLRSLTAEHWEPVRDAAAGDRGGFLAARGSSWSSYRTGYERRMPAAEGARDEAG